MERPRAFEERLNTWLQNVAIIAAGLWAAYTFIFKEFVQPGLAPAHIAVDLELTQEATHSIGVSQHPDSFAVLLGRVTLSNPSPQRLYKIAGVGLLYGYTLNMPIGLPQSLASRANILLSEHQDSQLSQQGFVGRKELAGVVSFTDPELLQPGEVVKQDWLFHVPSGKYDYVELVATVMQALDDKTATVDWQLSGDGDTLVTRLFMLDSNGMRLPVPDEQIAGASKQLLGSIQMATAQGRAVLHLGQN